MPSTAPLTVSLTFCVAFSPMIASLTMPTTLSSVVSFFQPGGLQGSTRTLQSLLRMQEGLAGVLPGPGDGLAARLE